MTPTETAVILRKFAQCLRVDKYLWGASLPGTPTEVGSAVEAAIALFDRLEAAEKERELWAVIRDGMITPGHLAVGESVPMVENTRLEAEDLNRKFIAEINGPTYMGEPTPSVSDNWPIYADPFAYVIQHLNSTPYPLTKDETITFIKELRALYNAAPEAKP